MTSALVAAYEPRVSGIALAAALSLADALVNLLPLANSDGEKLARCSLAGLHGHGTDRYVPAMMSAAHAEM